jgi:hypothetical protein
VGKFLTFWCSLSDFFSDFTTKVSSQFKSNLWLTHTKYSSRHRHFQWFFCSSSCSWCWFLLCQRLFSWSAGIDNYQEADEVITLLIANRDLWNFVPIKFHVSLLQFGMEKGWSGHTMDLFFFMLIFLVLPIFFIYICMKVLQRQSLRSFEERNGKLLWEAQLLIDQQNPIKLMKSFQSDSLRSRDKSSSQKVDGVLSFPSLCVWSYPNMLFVYLHEA